MSLYVRIRSYVVIVYYCHLASGTSIWDHPNVKQCAIGLSDNYKQQQAEKQPAVEGAVQETTQATVPAVQSMPSTAASSRPVEIAASKAVTTAYGAMLAAQSQQRSMGIRYNLDVPNCSQIPQDVT